MAWIETSASPYLMQSSAVATREGGVDRNTQMVQDAINGGASPPARVAWIETSTRNAPPQRRAVATREGGVDRNFFRGVFTAPVVVATREGGVDRNSTTGSRC